MKTTEAISAYLSHRRRSGKESVTVRTTRRALRTVLAPALEVEVSDLAAEGTGEALRTLLGQRVSRPSGQPLAESTRALYLSITGAFLAWCIRRGWLKSNPLDLPAPARTTPAQPVPSPAPPVPPIVPKHVGQIVRRLREHGGLTRGQLEELTNIPEATLRKVEMGRQAPTAATIRKLLAVPCMATLPERAKQAGLDLGLGDNGVGEA